MHLIRIHEGDRALVVDVSDGIPAVVHWGPDPGDTPADPGALLERPVPPGSLDVDQRVRLVPLGGDGFAGRPGLEGHRDDGTAAWPRFPDARWSSHGRSLRVDADDADAGLHLRLDLTVDHTVRLHAELTNTGDTTYHLQRLAVTLPLPDEADELLRFDGHWAKEFTPRRAPWPGGTQVVENRRGRTSHDHVPVAFAGTTGFDEASGSVHGIHLAWSGNSELRFEQLADGRRIVQVGELLAPGEVVLAPGETYRSPTVHAVSGTGLTQVSRAFHEVVRQTVPDRPRPVLLNTWEAVYFDHDMETLRALAQRAADVGVERFVLDDGWFGGRRHDRAGLGDWWVSPEVYPDGLAPLIDHVVGLGMEFGIWVEPEMVNPDSDLYRSHPEWVLGDPTVLGRNQLVLDLSIDACWQYLYDHLDRLLADHDIAYVKWDMNRDLVGAGAHAQVEALYRLLAALRSAHPGVEIESCASGGGRADLGILQWTDRIWTSDCNDPLERQVIQRGFSHLFPPAVMGAHIGPPRVHTTGRSQRLAFRAATALFGHLGIEWNLLEASDRHLDALREWVALHKRLRPLLHGGDVVRLDVSDPAALAHGVVARDRSEGVFAYVQLTQSVHSAPPRLVLRDLNPDRTYTVEHVQVPGEVLGLAAPPAWMREPVEATGRWLTTVGLQMPLLFPESAVLLRIS